MDQTFLFWEDDPFLPLTAISSLIEFWALKFADEHCGTGFPHARERSSYSTYSTKRSWKALMALGIIVGRVSMSHLQGWWRDDGLVKAPVTYKEL